MAKIAVVGGGLAGCAAAIRLAHAGHRVTLFEKNGHLGGKMNVWQEGGYYFDMGPTIITKPDVLDRLFADVGRRREDYLELVALDPQWRAFFADGTHFDLYSSLQGMVAELQRFAPDEVGNYLQFLAYSHRMNAISDRWFYWRSYGSIGDMVRANPMNVQSLGIAMNMDPFTTMHQAIHRHFKDERLAQMFEHFVQYVGSSPFVAPAILCLIPWVQIALGCWYPMGGTGAIARALARLCEELGVEVRLHTPVERIETREGRVTGVVPQGGATEAFDVVVANSDIVRTLERMLTDPQARAYLRRHEKQLEPACSGIVLYLGCDRTWPQLRHHDFFFSADSNAEFRDLYERRVPHEDPTCYLAVPNLTDPDVAPPGCTALYVLVHTPYITEAFDWERETERYREVILDKLERSGLTGLRESIRVSHTVTPRDLERMYWVNRGAIYGVVTQRGLNAAFKTANRSEIVRGLYWAGGSVNPGPGVPMVLMSGQIAANCVLEDYGAGTSDTFAVPSVASAGI
ncbi:MAG: phytoene desaturase family protein [Chloroherpetonaceae bacterium]|nr:phytoene desaturase family protein [Chthonomonadaceae bacterium]MDW8209279.1 phytoene desaturase family protein [Chloroherpetonaceae bacterium]